MPSTREDRIYRHYRALKKRWDWQKSSKSAFWMFLARAWGTPIRDLKKIVDSKGGMP